jgi:hypothetical protein
LALSLHRGAARPAARALNERPDLVRAVYLELTDADCTPDELAGWLAGGL